MVGRDRPANSANFRWSIPSNAREARNCAAVMIVCPFCLRPGAPVLVSIIDSIIDVQNPIIGVSTIFDGCRKRDAFRPRAGPFQRNAALKDGRKRSTQSRPLMSIGAPGKFYDHRDRPRFTRPAPAATSRSARGRGRRLHAERERAAAHPRRRVPFSAPRCDRSF